MSQPLPFPQASAQAAQCAPLLRGIPLLRLGFRPFYLGAAFVAGVSVPLWVLMFAGIVQPRMALAPLLWHAHEMLFGFAVAVIAGFLLTAVKAWTGLPTPRGASLGALALVWLAARVAAFVGPYPVYAALDMLLLPAVAFSLLVVLVQARNKRNMPLISLLLFMAVANGVFHLSMLEIITVPALSALYAELALVLMVVCVIAGRVVPVFTRNVTPGLALNIPRKFELALLAVTAAALLMWVCAAPALLAAALSAIAAVMHAVRLALWKPWVTLRRPILWILHLAYAWMPIGFALLAAAQLGWLPTTLAIHALAVGVVGGLIIGMLTRTARGHTGRPLQASRAEVAAYACVLLAAVMRVVVPAAAPQWSTGAVYGAACLWALAFGIYLVIYTPWLLRARLDGKDG